MASDSPVATAFTPAPDHWTRAGAEPRAIVIHMAEGGGTVPWLTRLDGNSSHYVVEYTGRVVQMVRESEAAGSMNPKLTRLSNDAPYTFEGETVVYGRRALDAAGIAADPNRYAIAIEVEGFAANGPNPAQVKALTALVADIRRRHGRLHLLGHRDQQSYKPCPGHKMPWATFGGHGAPPVEADMIPKPITNTTPLLVSAPAGPRYALDGVTVAKTTSTALTDRYSPFGVGTLRAVYLSSDGTTGLYLLKPASVKPIPPPTAVPDPAQLAAARKDGRKAMQTEAVAAVSALVP
jgi:hypothetical protein